MTFVLSSRQRMMLAALAAKPGAEFAPVQVQKFFFLLDESKVLSASGKLFRFEPYDYGPFDKAVYQELEALEQACLVEISQLGPGAGARRYSLSARGQQAGAACLTQLTAASADYVSAVSDWVRKLSFAELVGAIYNAYPAMRSRSIFLE